MEKNDLMKELMDVKARLHSIMDAAQKVFEARPRDPEARTAAGTVMSEIESMLDEIRNHMQDVEAWM